jgi:hypothetical protein
MQNVMMDHQPSTSNWQPNSSPVRNSLQLYIIMNINGGINYYTLNLQTYGRTTSNLWVQLYAAYCQVAGQKNASHSRLLRCYWSTKVYK